MTDYTQWFIPPQESDGVKSTLVEIYKFAAIRYDLMLSAGVEDSVASLVLPLGAFFHHPLQQEALNDAVQAFNKSVEYKKTEKLAFDAVIQQVREAASKKASELQEVMMKEGRFNLEECLLTEDEIRGILLGEGG